DELWTKTCGQERWRGTMEGLTEKMSRVSSNALWELRAANRNELVEYVRERLGRELAIAGGSEADIARARTVFDPNSLTLGFARRFATYKRPNLLLHDPERLVRILTNRERPVQLVVAGKAHPQDQPGKAMIQAWIRFVRRPDVRPHAVFLSDYDLQLAERLVQGVDVWINTPRRPWEASGTSGMKVLVNGGINLSELDGWWAEAYSPEMGWALGDGKEHDDDPAWDAAEAEQLYKTLEEQVIPAFYKRDRSGIPFDWIPHMRDSMARLTPLFSANRAMREYTENYYLPAANAYRERERDRGAIGAALLKWNRNLSGHWEGVHFGQISVESTNDRHAFEVPVYLDGVDPEAVRVEVYGAALDGEAEVRQEMTRGTPLVGSIKGYLYSATVPATRPASYFTPRVIPYHAVAQVPLEESHILWSR
ncbi:MAG TPA: alpha-glucan family phosphorylase, partial [Candidatus Binataceae bacterium]|nr:alpha-glucan family phosphorylase [Candidatus Binataceae bacterium]